MRCQHSPDPFYGCGSNLIFFDFYAPHVYFICKDCMRLTGRKLSKYSRKLKELK